tara:strand:+ start:1296 stop:1706 length:411 start_codon:yes stop_codon:yes gene_type:complete
MYQKSKNLVFIICFLTILFSPLVAVGQRVPEGVGIVNQGIEATLDRQDLAEIRSNESLTVGLGRIMNFFFSIIGIFFFVVVIFGGLRWMTAGGNEEKVATGKKFVLGGIEGMIVIFLSYTFIYLVLTVLRAATSNT